MIGGFRSVLCVSGFPGSLLVIVIKFDGSEKRNCEGGLGGLSGPLDKGEGRRSPIFFLALRASVWSENREGGRGRGGEPLPWARHCIVQHPQADQCAYSHHVALGNVLDILKRSYKRTDHWQ